MNQDFSENPYFEENFSEMEGFEEIKSLFKVEAFEQVQNMAGKLLQLESGNVPLPETLAEIYRFTHSLKGDSFSLGFIDIGNVAHEFETFMSNLKKNPDSFNNQTFNNMFKYIDNIRKILNEAFKIENVPPEQIKEKSLTLLEEPEKLKTSQNKKNQVELSTIAGITNKGKLPLSKVDNETIRVSIQKIDKLINLSGELLISKINQDQHILELKEAINSLQDYVSYFKENIIHKNDNDNGNGNKQKENYSKQHIEHILDVEERLNYLLKSLKKDNTRFTFLVDELQYNSRNTRMLPVSFLIEPLKIVVRNTSKNLNKMIIFSVNGENIEIDRFLIEKLKDPLSHIIRNAIDHGIETTEERIKLGKPEQAGLSVNVSLSGNNVVFEIIDDGSGIDYEKVKQKALKLGMIIQEQADIMNEEELKELIFIPGFSTTEKITEISGRGVGLDVVKSMIEELMGKISLRSEPGKGTKFKLFLPLTLTTFDGFLVNVSNQKFVIPADFILRTLNISLDDIIINETSRLILIDEKPVKLVYLSDALQLGKKGEVKPKELMGLLIESDLYKVVFLVDEIIENRKIFMKNIGTQLKRVKNLSGATILGTGEPVLILNIPDLVDSIFQASFSINLSISDDSEVPVKNKARKKVLVVDDSITTRTLEKNILEFSGFEVVLARNGLEGIESVEKHLPDLIITDVDMPKMNGFQFSNWLKKESSYKETPLIMITSHDSDEFKRNGLEAGVDAYIVKGQFDQKKLLDTIAGLI